MIGQNTLISRDSKGKIRVVEISYQWEDDHNGFVIRRYTSQYGGKITTQPEIVISKGTEKAIVENVKGKTYEEAAQILDNAN